MSVGLNPYCFPKYSKTFIKILIFFKKTSKNYFFILKFIVFYAIMYADNSSVAFLCILGCFI